MRCPFCRHPDTRVSDSRIGAEGMEVRRRRYCPKCNNRFTTHERMERSYPMVQKNSGNIEYFQPEKIRRGLQRSVEKRPVSSASIEAMLDRICERLANLGVEQISSKEIGELILSELLAFDDVAYVRFASVYRKFNSVKDFSKELKKLSKVAQH